MKLRDEDDKLVRGVGLLTPLMLLVALVGSALANAPVSLGYITSAVAAGLAFAAAPALTKRWPGAGTGLIIIAMLAGQKAQAHFISPILYERYGGWFEFQWLSVLALSAFVMHWSYREHVHSRQPRGRVERGEDEAETLDMN